MFYGKVDSQKAANLTLVCAATRQPEDVDVCGSVLHEINENTEQWREHGSRTQVAGT